MQLGQHNKAVKYVEDVLSIDKHNLEALKLRRQLTELGFIHKDVMIKFKKVTVILGAMCVVSLIGFGIIKGYNKTHEWLKSKEEEKSKEINNDKTNLDNFQGNSEKTDKNAIIEAENAQNKDDNSSNNNDSFDVDTLKSYTEAGDYENIIKYIEKYDIEALNINDKIIAQNAANLIKEKGILALYEKGIAYMQDKKYDSAIESFNLVYKYSEDMYLNEHILFMMAGSYENLEDIESANKYYELYVDKYLEGGSYIQQCVYSLAINNEGIDKEKSRKYAEIVTIKFNESEYNNSRIQNILK